MGIRDQLKVFRRNRATEPQRRRSLFNLVAPNQITEESLQVWRELPEQIRQDPSLVSFQVENDRLHGSSTPNGERYVSSSDEIESTLNDIKDGSEYINLKTYKPKARLTSCSCEEKSPNCENHNSIIDHQQPFIESGGKSSKQIRNEKLIKKICLLIFWLLSTLTLLSTHEKHLMHQQLLVPEYEEKLYFLPRNPMGNFKITLLGAFDESHNSTADFLTVQLQVVKLMNWNDSEIAEDILEPWIVPIVPEDEFDTTSMNSKNRTFFVSREILSQLDDDNNTRLRLKMFTNETSSGFALKLFFDPLVINIEQGIVLATLILSAFYGLLVWEVFHRTFIAIVCSTASIAILAFLGDRPTMEEIVVWMDMELLTLLFSMMILVAILTETGIFDYLAVLTFEISGGKIWPLIYSLLITTCCISSVLDNMTTVLLMTPVAIRLCEVMEIDPVPVLMGIIVHANIGGAITPIGDPISIIVCSNHFISRNGVTFTNFVAHCLPGVVLTVLFSCLYMRLKFWDINSLRVNEPKVLRELRREIIIWQRAANSLQTYSKDVDIVRETLLKKVEILKYKLKKKQTGVGSEDAYIRTLEELKAAYPIRHKTLLIQSVFTLVFVISMFFVQSVPSLQTLPLGWVALLGVVLLMIISSRNDMDAMVHRIEWTTLLFFAAMFVMMECVERLGLFIWIGNHTEKIILLVSKEHRLAAAVFIILWISAITSAVLDSIPVTAMMVKLVVSLVAKDTLDLPLQPLVWALVFGCCLGGNGTLYGASANVLSAGMAEQHGYKISFTRYLKFAFPMMIGQVALITAYLMVAHILYAWH
ncbi:P protein [Episyrphus balteatus]|uniref:P protein n=1 Tax=Episyrphus balteatus TaxID=286459 RepID=UPI0024863914|nr:P protein [Episyrphus balteatus]